MSTPVLSLDPALDALSVKTIPLPLPEDTDFSLANIPFGVFTPPQSPSDTRHICTAIGGYVLDLYALTKHGVFSTVIPSTAPHEMAMKDPAVLDVLNPAIRYPHPLLQPNLNLLATAGRRVSRALRDCIRNLVLAGGIILGQDVNPEWPLGTVFRMDSQDSQGRSLLQMHVPFKIGDYTDFYAGIHHAYNVGCLFRGPDNALQPNYLHFPVGYHGRASTVCCSGAPVTRPNGQLPPPAAGGEPRFGPSEKFDYELELAAFVGLSNEGTPVPVDKAIEHIFGFVLMNDWSARDVQAWEYIPLGPFLGKSFGTTISPWVVTVDALEPFRVNREDQGVKLLPYLTEKDPKTLYDFTLQVHINPASPSPKSSQDTSTNPLPPKDSPPLTTTSPKHLIWSFQQMLAHHTVNGCNLLPGDLLGSGTISGPNPGEEGSLLEMSKNGTQEVEIRGTSSTSTVTPKSEEPIYKRKWLQNGDEVVFKGWGVLPESRERVGFGECRGRVGKAVELGY